MTAVWLPKMCGTGNCDAVCLEYETGSRDIRMEIMGIYRIRLQRIATAMEIPGRDRADA